MQPYISFIRPPVTQSYKNFTLPFGGVLISWKVLDQLLHVQVFWFYPFSLNHELSTQEAEIELVHSPQTDREVTFLSVVS